VPPTNTPALTATPTAIPEETQKLLQGAYGVVVMTKAAEVLTAETAKQVQDGKLTGLKSYGALLVIGAIISETRALFNQPAPVPDLQPVWDEGKPAVAALTDVLARWLDQKITSADIPRELEPVTAQTDKMQKAARQLFVERYGIDVAKLDEWYDTTITEMRDKLQQALTDNAPAPTAAEAPATVAPTDTPQPDQAVATEVPAPTQAPQEQPTQAQPTDAPVPTEPSQPADFDRNGDGKVTCADFDTRTQAKVALAAGYKNLDRNDDGVPCESLPE
jgi:hypothetical protein